MMNAYYRPYEESDIDSVGSRLRELDLTELSVLGGCPIESLRRSCNLSSECNAIVIDGEPEALFGLATQEGLGVPWLLCTDEITRVAYRLIKHGRKWVRDKLEEHGVLSNYVLEEHTEAQMFISLMGFDFTEIADLNGHSFIRFEKRKV